MNDFLSGYVMMGFLVSGLLFLRFWKTSHERIFLLFSIAFFLMGVERVCLEWAPWDGERRAYIYLIRLFAFSTIIVGILHKNISLNRSVGVELRMRDSF